MQLGLTTKSWTRWKLTPFQILVYLGALIPLILIIWGYFTDNLTFNPIQEVTLRTGKAALIMLLGSLACTPLNTVFGFRSALKVRRGLGLFAFFYALTHFLIFVGLDYVFNPELILEAIFEKRYALIGFGAFLILLPLALTSTKGWQKRLKKTWKTIHKFVYLAGILVIVHFVWLVKSDIREPLIYGAVLAVLLLLRVPPIRRWASQLRYRLPRRTKAGGGGGVRLQS